MDDMPTTALPVVAHTYMHTLMQYCSNLCTPHVTGDQPHCSSCNHWTNIESQV